MDNFLPFLLTCLLLTAAFFFSPFPLFPAFPRRFPLCPNSQGRSTRYAYDPAGRLSQKTLPNGITQRITWDNGDRLTQIKIARADGTAIETLDYQYDADGKRTEKRSGGSSQAETPMEAAYDTANRLTQLTIHPNTPNARTYTLSYDPQGNLTKKQNSSDPQDSTTYTWDARGQLSQLQSPSHQASFQYDPLGRRIGKTVNGQTVQYLYDGQQAIAEIRNNALDATYHTGIALDEVLARYAASGNKTLLTDALGSVIAQTDESQTVSNWYAYSPYGESQSIGPDNQNPLQYTGRENDGTGLYYYRARYFDAVGKQWLSDDPIGLKGGINQRAYVGGDPVSYLDPMGLDAELCVRPLQFSVPYARHCFTRFNRNNGDTLSFDPNGVHRDPNPSAGSCTKADGKENDDCVRREMQKCATEGSYDFFWENCCHCVEKAFSACGLSVPSDSWPNRPVNPGIPKPLFPFGMALENPGRKLFDASR